MKITMKQFSSIILPTTLAMAGCQSPPPSPSPYSIPERGQAGQLRLYIHDAPVEGLDALAVEVLRVEVHHVDVGWITVSASPRKFDLLSLQGGKAIDLADLPLPEGKYNQIRLVLSDDCVATIDGEEVSVEVKSAARSGFKIHGEFQISPDHATSLEVDFDASRSLQGSRDKPILHPEVRIVGYDLEPLSMEQMADDTESSWIGPSGGELVLADGAKLVVPEGAVASDTYIGLREEASSSGFTKVYELTPHGIDFAVPLEFTVPVDVDEASRFGVQPQDLVLYLDGAPVTTEVVGGNRLKGEVGHFSIVYGQVKDGCASGDVGDYTIYACVNVEGANHNYWVAEVPMKAVGTIEAIVDPVNDLYRYQSPDVFYDIASDGRPGPLLLFNGVYSDQNCIVDGCIGYAEPTMYDSKLGESLSSSQAPDCAYDRLGPPTYGDPHPQVMFAWDRKENSVHVDSYVSADRTDAEVIEDCMWCDPSNPYACAQTYPTWPNFDLALGGTTTVLFDGEKTNRCLACDGDVIDSFEGALGEREPRTALGVSEDGKTLYVLVSRPGTLGGLTGDDVSTIMKEFGASRALLLDGGHSSALMTSGVFVTPYADAVYRGAFGGDAPRLNHMIGVFPKTAPGPESPDDVIVIDQGSIGFQRGCKSDHSSCDGVYWGCYDNGSDKQYWWTWTNGSETDCTSRFTPVIPWGGTYDVYARFWSFCDQSSQVPYVVRHADGVDTVIVDQYGGFEKQEVYLGTYHFSGGDGEYIEIGDATGEPYGTPSPPGCSQSGGSPKKNINMDSIVLVPA